MVGNKIDLVNQRKVTTDEAKQLAQSYDIPYLETSAKTGHNVSEVFMHLARCSLFLFSIITCLYVDVCVAKKWAKVERPHLPLLTLSS
jgi:Fe2+ transport system protein B